ncbi:MAG: DNA polymerase III subunit alpha, partial [Candidatus Dadabacteria bacterium]
MPEFVHLHNHTEFSLLDGATRVGDLADIMVEHKSPAVAMTDHGNLFGAVSFYKAIKARGAKPILGCEVYVAPGDRRERKNVRGQTNAYHLVLLVKNETGYRNLNRLVTKAYMEGFYYKPRIDWELLQEHHEGLIALSGCMQGEIAQAIVAGDRDEARRKTRMFVELFGKDFYLEIQANGLPEQELINRQKRDLAAELGIPLVATNDNHYLRREDAYPHDCLLCIGTRSQLEQQDRMRFPNDQFYVKHPDEMWETFADVRESLDNTLRIAEDCNFDFEFGTFHLPRFGDPGDDLDAMLEEVAQKGLERRLDQIAQSRDLTAEQRHAYQERLAYELGVIREMGFAGYFLIVSDFIRWAKQNRIPVGPGRGSAAGSLVSYAIEITDLDPLQYGLLFERFLNPERRSMPDIDVDICMNRRGEVIEYVSNRYGGADHVAQIAAFGTAKGRQIFKDVGRVFGLTFADTDRITKLMPNPPAEFSLKELWESDADLRQAVQADPRLEDVYRVAQQLEGITRHASVHAAGVVLSDRPLVDHLPLFRGEHGESVTQF